jgi:hypothetical protein
VVFSDARFFAHRGEVLNEGPERNRPGLLVSKGEGQHDEGAEMKEKMMVKMKEAAGLKDKGLLGNVGDTLPKLWRSGRY